MSPHSHSVCKRWDRRVAAFGHVRTGWQREAHGFARHWLPTHGFSAHTQRWIGLAWYFICAMITVRGICSLDRPRRAWTDGGHKVASTRQTANKQTRRTASYDDNVRFMAPVPCTDTRGPGIHLNVRAWATCGSSRAGHIALSACYEPRTRPLGPCSRKVCGMV